MIKELNESKTRNATNLNVKILPNGGTNFTSTHESPESPADKLDENLEQKYSAKQETDDQQNNIFIDSGEPKLEDNTEEIQAIDGFDQSMVSVQKTHKQFPINVKLKTSKSQTKIPKLNNRMHIGGGTLLSGKIHPGTGNYSYSFRKTIPPKVVRTSREINLLRSQTSHDYGKTINFKGNKVLKQRNFIDSIHNGQTVNISINSGMGMSKSKSQV